MMDHIYKGILDSLDSYIVVIEDNGNISFTNKTWGQLSKRLGATNDLNWQGMNYFSCCSILQLNSTEYARDCQRQVAALLQGKQSEFTITLTACTVESEIWLEVTGSIVTLDNTRYVLLNHSNIIDRKKDHAEIEKLTLIDIETGLANHKSFHSFYFNEWQRSKRNRSEVALLIAEMDHTNLDQRQTASIAEIFTRHARRACDLAAVLDNNQFALVLGQIGTVSCEFVAQSIYQEITALHFMTEAGQAININIGISSATPTLIDTSDMLLNSVTLALNKAKASQQQCINHHCPTIVFKDRPLMKN
ncbi:MAG: GGDEF domain-containing protein [Pseudomonadales bacterium]|nr:GGDEF domain-containing protein [Pseudomonadales bacterium]NRA17771.1 GGDEF domain-containing protein [Oceanospirillaceae bacterium]